MVNHPAQIDPRRRQQQVKAPAAVAAPEIFEILNTKKQGVKVAAKARGRSDRSLKEIISSDTGAKAFITTIDNGKDINGVKKKGHRAIVQRLTEKRYPLVTFAGPSTPEMLGNKKVYGEMKEGIYEELIKNINYQISRITGGKG